MSQRRFGRVLAAAALIAALTLTLPSQAEASSRGSSESLWGWLAGFLESRIAALLGRDVSHERQAPASVKQGGCIDPNGCVSNQTTGGTSGATCAAWNDQGGCIDPNG
jgi:hypothetical protein